MNARRGLCCAAFYQPGGEVHLETGTVAGHIAAAARQRGFGYDPLFIARGP